LDGGYVAEDAQGELHAAGEEGGAVRVGQGGLLLRGQWPTPGRSVVLDIATCGLVGHPRGDVRRGGAGAFSELLGGDRLSSTHRTVETQLVPDDDEGGTDPGGEVADDLTDEGIEPVGIDIAGELVREGGGHVCVPF